MKTKHLLLLVFMVLLFTGCADVETVENCVTDKPYGFFSGLWHGIIAPISFFGSLMFDSIAMYAVNNNGGWYDFGFVLGAGILSLGFGSSKK
jgi:hypothetical protein